MKVSTRHIIQIGALCLFTMISGDLAAQKVGAVTVEENNKAVERVLSGVDPFEDDSWNPFANDKNFDRERRRFERHSKRSDFSSSKRSSCRRRTGKVCPKSVPCSAKKRSCGSKVVRRCYGGVCVKVK